MINFDRLNNKICLDLSHTFCMTSINVSICSQYLLIFHQHWHSFTCRRPTVLWSFSLQNTNFSRTLTTLNTACTSLFEHLIWSSSLQNCLSVVPTFVISQLTRDFFSLSDLAISKDAANLISNVENTNWKRNHMKDKLEEMQVLPKKNQGFSFQNNWYVEADHFKSTRLSLHFATTGGQQQSESPFFLRDDDDQYFENASFCTTSFD